MKGSIKVYFEDKHYGFLTTYDGKDIFFHASEIQGGKRPHIGDACEFSTDKDIEGRSRAVHVNILQEDSE